MKRLLVLLFLPLLCAAVPVPVRLVPAEPLLGVPLLLTWTLPDADTALAGLPPLAPFELLEPPQRSGRELRLLLLPMRPGKQRIPSIPLHHGPSRQLSTEAFTVVVGDGLPQGAAAAPLKTLDRHRPGQIRWLAGLAAATLLLGIGLGLTCRRLRKAGPPPLDALRGEALLAELQRRLELLPADPRRRLAERLARLRFAPAQASEQDMLELLADYRAAMEAA